MFRITTSLVNARRLLYRRARPDIHLAAISRFPPYFKYKKPQEREPCPPPLPPPPPTPKDDTLFWGAMTLLFLTGGFVLYAKTNPELRDWLTINASWLDDLIAVVYQENMSYGEFAKQCKDDMKKAIKNLTNDRTCTPPIEPPEPNPECLPQDPEGDYVVVNLSDLDIELDDDEEDALEPCPNVPPPIITKDICEIEYCLRDLGDEAVHNYMTARDACIYFNKLVEETMIDFSIAKMRALNDASAERIALVKESIEKSTCATAKLDELTRYFDCGVQAPKDVIKNTKDLLKEYGAKVKKIKIEWQWENDRSLAMDIQCQKVEALINKYTEETQTMSKNLDYLSEKPYLLGDPDLLLHHTLRYFDLLKEELLDALAGMTERVNRGIDTLPQGEKEVKARNAEIQSLYKKRLGEVEAEYNKRAADTKAKNEKYRKDSLKKQLEQSQDTLVLRLSEKTVEATKQLDKLVAEKVLSERKLMAKEIAKMTTKLKIVEAKLNDHLKAERETRRSQDLWNAGASLLAATKKGEPFVRVDKELKAIENASGDGDKLVLTVLKAIPESVRKKGVVPESVLRENYRVMEDVALKVALVEQEGAPLPVFILSYLQSLFLFLKISGIPQQEFDKPPKEPAKELDTFDLLQRARFWIERGDIASALKYVTALEGASRAAAATWHEAARSHLETRQAAEAVLAHAAALGLQYI